MGWAEGFQKILAQNFENYTLEKFAEHSALLSVLLFFVGSAFLIGESFGEEMVVSWFFASFGIGFGVHYFLQLYIFEKRKRAIDESVSDLLVQASMMQPGENFFGIINYMASAEHGAIGREFLRAKREIKLGQSVEKALKNMVERTESRQLEKAVELLLEMYNTGTDMRPILRGAAEDLAEQMVIEKERGASMVIEKYTLLVAGAVIVPLMLGLVAGMSQGLDVGAISAIVETDAGQKKELFEAAKTATSIYIIEFGFLASVFVSLVERNLKKSVLYAGAVVPAGVVIFLLVGGA